MLFPEKVRGLLTVFAVFCMTQAIVALIYFIFFPITGLVVRELAEGVDFAEVQAKTAAKLTLDENYKRF